MKASRFVCRPLGSGVLGQITTEDGPKPNETPGPVHTAQAGGTRSAGYVLRYPDTSGYQRHQPALKAVEADRSRRRNWSQSFSLRWIVCHMIEEYARRNGHDDLREAIDGSTGE